MRILIVDDKEKQCLRYQKEIGTWGYSADFVNTRDEALAFIEEAQPPVNLVLVDYKLDLGDPNGIQVITDIKKRHKDIECILYTFWEDSSIGRKALLEAGAYRYVESSDWKLLRRYLDEVKELLELRESVKLTGEVGVNLLDMINSMPFEVSILDRNHKILFVNKTKAAKHFNPFDKDRAVLIGKKCFDIFPVPDERGQKCPNCPVAKVLESKISFQRKTSKDLKIHHFSTDRDGKKYPVSEYAAPLKFDENGEVSLILHVTEDITRVHYLKEFTHQSQVIVDEDRLIDTLLENIGLMGYARARLFYSKDHNLVGVKCIGVHKILSDKKFESIQIPISKGKLEEEMNGFMIPEKFDSEDEYLYKHSEIFGGDIIEEWIACRLIISKKIIGILEVDNKGKGPLENKDLEVLADLARFFSQILSNIRRNKEIEKTNITLDGIIESVPDGIIVLDEEGYRIKVNKATEDILKTPKEKLIKKRILDDSYYLYDYEPRKIIEMLDKGPIKGYITALKDSKGNRIDISHNVSYLFDSNKNKIGTVGVFRDIRQEKSLQEVANDLISEDDINEILQRIVEKACEMMQLYGCYIRLEENGVLIAKAGTGFKKMISDYADQYQIKPGEGISGRVYLQGEPIKIEDLASDGRFKYAALIKSEGLKSMLSLPLKYIHRPIGTLNCYTNKERRFSEQEINLMMTFANQASIAIQNARNKAKLIDKVNELDIEAKMEKIILDSSIKADISDMLHEFLEKTISLLGAESGHIRLLEDEQDLVCVASIGEYSRFLPRVRRIGELFSGKVVKENNPLIVNNTDEDKNCSEFRKMRTPDDRRILEGLKSFICCPIIYSEKNLGTINFEALHYNYFDEKKVYIIKKLIDRISPVIKLFQNQNKEQEKLVKARHDAEESFKKLNTLFKLSESLTSTFDLDKICQNVSEAILTLDEKYACCLFRIRNERSQLVVRGSAGFSEDERFYPIDIGDRNSISGEVAIMGKPIKIYDFNKTATQHKYPSVIKEYGLTSMLCMPMKLKEETLGVLTIYTKQPHDFQKSEIDIFETFISQVNRAIWNAETYGKMISFVKIAQYVQIAGDMKKALKYILTGITAREGLNFNRAIIFLYDRSEDLFRGFAAVGTKTKISARAFLDEIRNKLWTFDNILQQVTKDASNPGDLDYSVGKLTFKKTLDFPPILEVIRNKRPFVCQENYSSDLDFSEEFQRVIDKNKFVFSPIFSEDELLGIIYCDRKFDEKEIEFRTIEDLKMFSDLTASTIRLFRIAETRENIIREISHNIATPISSICTTVDLLLEESALHKETFEKLKAIQRKARHSDLMIKKITELTRIKRGKLKLEPVEINIQDIIDNARYLFGDQDIDRIKVMDFKDCIVRVDSTSVYMALAMLIDNALKYSDNREVVKIEVDYSDGYVKISVSDKGIGIKEKDKEKILNDFYRVDEISGITGLGIGLSIARDYVEENGGKLNFESKHGKGSKFWFELPISHKKRKEVQNDV